MNEQKHTVEINGQTFTAEQWEAVQHYVGGTSSQKYLEGTALGNRMQLQVRAFHLAMGQPALLWPTPLPKDRHPVRIELIREEFEELKSALAEDDLVETIDAAVDMLYVIFGLLVEMGVNAAPFFEEVHSSNMSKFGEDGKPIIAGPNDPDGVFEGRVKKGPHYFKPDLAGILEMRSLSALGSVD